MRSGSEVDPVTGPIAAGLDTLAAADPVGYDDTTLGQRLLDLVSLGHRTYAQVLRLVDVFDRRGLCQDDACRTTKAWLMTHLQLSGPAADRLVKAAQLLRQLPKLGAAVAGGAVSPEHVQQVMRLAARVDTDRLVEIDDTLAEAAVVLDVAAFGLVCARAEAYLHPDGRDPGKDAFDRRGLTLSPLQGMTAIHGQLDPEGAAAISTALDALMRPPGEDDTRTASQRRADALVELARLHLAAGDLPTVGGQRPQVGILVRPETLSKETLAAFAEATEDVWAAQRLRQFLDTDPDQSPGPPDPVQLFGRTTTDMWAGLSDPGPDQTAADDVTDPGDADAKAEPRRPPGAAGSEAEPTSPPRATGGGDEAGQSETGEHVHGRSPVGGSAGDGASLRPAALRWDWRSPGWADPPFLNWVGAVPAEVAQRLACDADITRIIMDPATGMPLDVGRSHRLVPYWIRKALCARDRTCRWHGCSSPAEWTDAHHLDWFAADNGETKVEQCCLLCRYHHVMVHEGGWHIDLDLNTGDVVINRPDGTPYLPRSRSPSWTGPTTHST